MMSSNNPYQTYSSDSNNSNISNNDNTNVGGEQPQMRQRGCTQSLPPEHGGKSYSGIHKAYTIPSNNTLPAGVAPPRRNNGNPDAPTLSE